MSAKEISLNPFAHIEQRFDDLDERLSRIEKALLKNPSGKKRITAVEAAEHIGIALQTLYFLCSAEGRKDQDNPVPVHRMPNGRKLFFYRDELDEWIKQSHPRSAKQERKPVRRDKAEQSA